jgi:hypothetical protein
MAAGLVVLNHSPANVPSMKRELENEKKQERASRPYISAPFQQPVPFFRTS